VAEIMNFRWEDVQPDEYDALRPIVRWEMEAPEGLIFHVAWFTDGGINVTDVWESRQQFDRFFQDRLMPGIQEVGIGGQPDVSWSDVHAYFSPAMSATAAR
jgi:hypothetical protein